jgi:plasmid stabilization system protein ParE
MTKSAKTSALTVGRASGNPEPVVGGRQQATASLPTSALLNRWRRTTLALALAAAAVVFFPARPARAVDAKKVSISAAPPVHTFGKGVKVGPDLKGVTVRRQRPVVAEVHPLLAAGDRQRRSGGNDLFRTFKRQRMPDWTDLSPQDVSAILDWLAADGPEQKPADERDAELAGAAEVARGGALFGGRTRLASGGPRLRRVPHRERPRPAHGRQRWARA